MLCYSGDKEIRVEIMRLEEKLSHLDELIWTQFEKVTQKADVDLGLDKYDLARGSLNVALAGSLAFTIYSGINWAKYESSQIVCVGYGLLMMATDVLNKKKIEEIRQFDVELLKKGRMVSPHYTPRRPVTLLLASMVIGTALQVVPEISQDQDVQYLYNLGLGAQYISILGSVSLNYFCSQLPKPPRASQGKLQQWYVGLKESLGVKGALDVNGVKCESNSII